MDIKCPYDDIKKEYIIPTKSWLKVISEMKIDDISTNGVLILSKLVEKEKVLVKLTKGHNKKTEIINKLIKGLPNMVFTYCVILCNDYIPTILKTKQFCNLQDEKNLVTLEIMKYYHNGSLSRFTNMNFKIFIKILEQLCLAQINLFMKTGYTHCDIHPGNILINKHSEEVELFYGYLPIQKKLVTKYEFIISDYDKIVSFESNDIIEIYLKIYKYIQDVIDFLLNSTLYVNILRTINILIEKLDDKNKIFYRTHFLKFQENYENDIIIKDKNYLSKYVNNINQKPDKKNDLFVIYKKYISNMIFEYCDKLLNYFNGITNLA
jgi:serine/threonine protein kinase